MPFLMLADIWIEADFNPVIVNECFFFFLSDMCHKDVYTELPGDGFSDQTSGYNS